MNRAHFKQYSILVHLLIINCLAIFSNGFSSQSYNPVIEDPLLEQWRWVKFPELSAKGVRCLVEDNSNTMWFGLDNGVINYNGSQWIPYNFNTGFTNAVVRELLFTDSGILYAGSDSGLYSFEKDKWQKIFSIPEIQSFAVHSIKELPWGGILCGTNIGLIRIDNNETTLYTSEAVSKRINSNEYSIKIMPDILTIHKNFNIADILVDKGHDIWLVTGYDNGHSGKILKLDIEETSNEVNFIRLYSEPSNARFFNGARIMQISSGEYWIINNQHDQGMLFYDGNEFRRLFLGKKFGEDEILTSILESKDGTIFIGAMGKIFTNKSGMWKIYRPPTIPIPSSTRILIYESSDGSLWIAGRQNEVYKFDYSESNWATYKHLNFEDEESDGTHWFLTVDGKAVEQTKDNWIAYGTEDGLIEAPSRLFISKTGKVWAVGSHNTVAASAYFNGSRWIRQLYPYLSWNIDYRSVLEDRNSGLWFGGNVDIDISRGQKGGTVYIKNPEEQKFEIVHSVTNQKEPSAYGLGQSKDGQMWLTGISTCQLVDKKWEVVASPEELKYHADYMCNADDGTLWIGSRNYGVFRYDGEKWTNFTISDGLASNSITYILPESKSSVLIATDKGFSRFDGSSWTNDLFPEKLIIIREGGSLRKSLSGEIWINKRTREWSRRSLTGIKNLTEKMKEFWAVFYKPDNQAPITKISRYDEQVYQPGNTIISWEGLDPWSKTPREKLQFSYRIDKTEWSAFSNKTNNIFLSLPSGDHSFEVRSRDLDYNIDQKPASIQFNVAPPFYLHPFFFVPMIILTLIIIVLEIGVIIRGQKLKAAKRETDNILHNVEEGLLLLDKECRIGTQYSKILEKIFEEESLAQKDLFDLLEYKIGKEDFSASKDYLELLFENNYDQKMMDDLNPLSEVTVNFEESNKIKYLAFKFRNIDTENNDNKEVMVTVKDITEQILLEQQLAESRNDAKRQMDWLISILHVDPPLLKEFIVTANEELKIVEKLIRDAKVNNNNEEPLKVIYRSIHLLKGNAGLLDLKVFSEQAHDFENQISKLQKQKSINKSEINLLKNELGKIQKTLSEVNSLLDRIGKIHEQMRPRRTYEHEVMIESLKNLVKQISNSQEKSVNLDTKKFKIEELPHTDRIFAKDIIVQLIRNSIAHGIETNEERKKLKKSTNSKIHISTFSNKNTYGFSVRDDGRGLQLDKLKQKAIKSEKWNKSEIDSWDDKQLTQLIFEQGISTTDNADMISGRGVGMDIVLSKIKDKNGEIDVSFEKGKFCEFRVSIPKN